MLEVNEERVCGRCTSTYLSYPVLLLDDFVVMCEWHEMQEDYGNVCDDCWHEISTSNKYAIPSDRQTTETHLE